MKFSEWKPIYQQIIDDFNFNQKKDEEAARILQTLLRPEKVLDITNLSQLIKHKKIYIFGAGPTLEEDIKESDFDGVLITADGATTPLLKNGIIPDIIVTDLDGYIPDQIEANTKGAKVIIHAHGDNISALKQWVPKFRNNILGTTQARPLENQKVYNFGGFTDGDRAVFLASHFEASRIVLVAFDFKTIGNYSYNYDSHIKLRKLTWSNLLIGMIQSPPVVFNVDKKK